MKAKEVAAIIEEFAPLYKQEEWDNAGFCIGSPETDVTGILVGFDCTLDLLKEAVAKGANMVITHHPLIFRGIKKISPEKWLGAVITFAIKNDLIIYAAHTNADKVMAGVSDLMADKLSLVNRDFLDEGGLGIVGDLQKPMASEEFISFVKTQYNLSIVRSSKLNDKEIKRVALCGGSGSSLIENAISSGADVYITGDLSYHNFFTEKDFMVIDMGHYESEIYIVDKFIALLKKKMHNFAILKADNNNPVYYY